MVSEYPHRSYAALDENNEIIAQWPTLIIVPYGKVRDGLDELEVIYVGQAFGDGSRNALDRLRNHSTLQRILAESAAKRPDDELIIVLVEYAEYQIFSSIDARAKQAIRDERDTDRWLNLFDNPLSEKTQISLAEAGLIRYFRPLYNEIYKKNFPKEDQKILNEAYRLDFSGLVVELNTEDLGTKLKSTHIGAGLHHIANYDLHDISKRQSFFALTGEDDNTISALNRSGPIF